MFELHNIYKTQLKKYNKIVTFKFVYNYVNKLPSPLLMYSLNYKYRSNKLTETNKMNVDETQVYETQVDETHVDETHVDETQVDET